MAPAKKIESELREIRNILEKVPDQFSMKHMVGATFGAVIFGLTFALKGLLLDVTLNLTRVHLVSMFLVILIFLSAEVYYIGYARVKNKSERPFGQFLIKRIISYLVIGFGVSTFLIYLYGLNLIVASNAHLFNTIIALAFPCCLGASIADLLKKY